MNMMGGPRGGPMGPMGPGQMGMGMGFGPRMMMPMRGGPRGGMPPGMGGPRNMGPPNSQGPPPGYNNQQRPQMGSQNSGPPNQGPPQRPPMVCLSLLLLNIFICI